MPWDPKERQIAEKVLTVIRSDKYKSKNYLFLVPFDLNQVPGYIEKVGNKPLDLQTIANNLNNDKYDNSSTFWKDVHMVFQNAIKYHAGLQTKWIAKFAKDMIKIVNKERKKAENPSDNNNTSNNDTSSGSKKITTKLKIKLKSKSSSPDKSVETSVKSNNSIITSTSNNTTSSSSPGIKKQQSSSTGKSSKKKLKLSTGSSSSTKVSSSPKISSTNANPPPAAVPSEQITTKKPKLKLKLSANSSSSNAAAPAASSAQPPQPKETKKVKNNEPPETTTSSSSSKKVKNKKGVNSKKALPKKGKPTQPKLKLKLSLNKSSAPPSNKSSSTSPTPVTSEAAVKESSQQSETTVKSEAPSAKIKISAPPPTSRGKELPQGVVAPTSKPSKPPSQPSKASSSPKPVPSTTKSTTSSKSAVSSKASGKGSSKAKPPPKPKGSKKSGGSKKVSAASKPSTSPTPPTQLSKSSSISSLKSQLDPTQKKLCQMVLSGLRRRKQKQITWFSTPVNDKNIIQDYRAKIKHPMDLQTIQSKLDKKQYKKVDAFVLDVRRVFANALRYNTSIKEIIRPQAVECLRCAEQMFQIFLQKNKQQYPPLLYCWNVCLGVLDTLYNLVNPVNKEPMAYYFLHPVSTYCGGQFPPDYLEKVPKPMDFGTVTANLIEGKYQTADAFATDCKLVLQNCQNYYQGRDDGKVFVEQAQKLNDSLSMQLQQLARYDSKASNKSNTMSMAAQPPPPPPTLLYSILEELRGQKYTDKATKITEPAMGPFEKPVSLTVFNDYTNFITEPMDLSTVEKKIPNYLYPEEFEFDMNLIWKNCEVYNSQRNDLHSVNMAKFAARRFRTIFASKMQQYDDPTSASASDNSPPNKKMKTSTTESVKSSSATNAVASTVPGNVSKGKSAPRISIAAAAARSKSPVNKPPNISPVNNNRAAPPKPKTSTSSNNTSSGNKSNQPVPLHIAIAKVKEAFPLRRAVKSLQFWEADCARYFKELMRHPWITTARPKFIFHVPVPTLFPELKEHYAAKIRKPMDLTTVECTLLAGNRYAGPEDFLQDIALVFANAIRFNKDGRDVGDPLSCAYYDASVHLLRYARWLSLELLIGHIDQTSEYSDEPGADGLPPFTWKLTAGNRKIAREEMENIVLKDPIEKSLEGDRYTWMEAECEKLLKALRHQSDVRYMTFFIQANYPADYTAFISKPMDWEKVQRTLKRRHYDTIGHVIDDLRLIFSNALKYNARHKGTETVSGQAYDAAKYMSNKLENAINKMLLSVSDRLERERIDHANAEREIEAAERAEEAAIRAAWKKGPAEKEDMSYSQVKSDGVQRSRIVRRAAQRHQATDFEIPFFDEEDNGQHERSYFEVVKFQKSMFEKQRDELVKMRKATAALGVTVLMRLMSREVAKNAANTETTPKFASSAPNAIGASDPGNDKNIDPNDKDEAIKPSEVLGVLEKEGRGPLQIKLAIQKPKTKSKKRKRPLQGFD